jgi:hypothetical protein
MLADAPVINWPAIGEIDIMEHVGFDRASSTARSIPRLQPRDSHGAGRPDGDRGRVHGVPPLSAHLDTDRITIGADDKPYFQFDREVNGGHDAWPFDAPQY